MSGYNKCQPGYTVPNHLAGFFTDTDILAKRHELARTREEKHRLELDEIHAKICEVEDLSLADQEEQADQLQKLKLTEAQLTGKIEAALKQQERCMADVAEQFQLEREAQLNNLMELKKALEGERKEKARREQELAMIEMKQEYGIEQQAREQEGLREQIRETQQQLNKVQMDHMQKKRQHFERTAEKTRAYIDDRDRLKAQIGEVRSDAVRELKEYRMKEVRLNHEKHQIMSQEHNDRAEMELRYGPLLMEKEDLEARISFLEMKIEQRKEEEKEKLARIVERFNKIVHDRAANFDRERRDVEVELEEKEEDLIERDAELLRIRSIHDAKIRKLNERLDKRAQEIEIEINEQNAKHNSELEDVCNRIRHRQLEDKIHNKRCEIFQLEAEHEAEENILYSRLKTLGDKEKSLRDGINSQQMKTADILARLNHQLSLNTMGLETEQRKYDEMLAQLEKDTNQARMTMENDVKDNLLKLTQINKNICDVQRKIANREGAIQESKEKLKRRTEEEIIRLKYMKDNLDEKIPPLQDRHNEVRERLRADKARHDIYMRNLLLEQQASEKEHDLEITRMQALLDSTRAQQTKEIDKVTDVLNKLLESNDDLLAKHEAEMHNLNFKLVEAFEDSSPDALETLDKLKDLKESYRESSKELEKTKLKQLTCCNNVDSEHEDSKRKLKLEIHNLNKQLLQDGITDAAQRKKIIEEKLNNISKKSANSSSPTMSKIEEARSKNLELKEKYESKKKDFHELRSQRQKDISVLSHQLSDHEEKTQSYRPQDKGTTYNYNAGLVRCVLDELFIPEEGSKKHQNANRRSAIRSH